MSDTNKQEEQPQRTKEQIEAEYNQYCSMAGDKQYRIEMLKNEITMINTKLFELNKQAAALLKSAQQEEVTHAAS